MHFAAPHRKQICLKSGFSKATFKLKLKPRSGTGQGTGLASILLVSKFEDYVTVRPTGLHLQATASRKAGMKIGPTKSRPEPSGTVRTLPGAVRTPPGRRPEPSGHCPDIVRRPTPPGAVQRPPHQTGKCPRIRLQLGR